MSTNNCTTITEEEKEINRNNSTTLYNMNDKYNYNLNNINSNYTPLKYKNYNTNDLRKESNNRQRNNISGLSENNTIGFINHNNNNILRFNSYRDNNFHSNLNNELEKNKLKLENEKLIKENILIKNELKDALNQLNKIKEQPLILNSNNNNNDLKEQLSLLNNKITIYEVSLEKTKNLYEKQINYYIQQLSNYNILIAIVNSFFEAISKKYIPNYNFNLQNIYINKFDSNSQNDINPLNKSDLEEKFQKIENYIYNIQQELNNYRLQGKRLDPPLSYNQYNENKNEFDQNKDREENEAYKAQNSNNSFMKTENLFENEIIAKKIRSNSTSKITRKYSTKKNGNNSCLNLSKKKRKEKSRDKSKEKSKDSKSKINKKNLDLDFARYGHKNCKTSKIPVNLTTKNKKKSTSKIKIKNK